MTEPPFRLGSESIGSVSCYVVPCADGRVRWKAGIEFDQLCANGPKSEGRPVARTLDYMRWDPDRRVVVVISVTGTVQHLIPDVPVSAIRELVEEPPDFL